MQEKTWYYEKWVGRQATFSPSRYVKWDFMALQGPEYHIYVQMTYFCTTIKKKSYCLKGSNSSISSQQARAKARQFGASTNEFLILLKWDSMALQGPDQPV